MDGLFDRDSVDVWIGRLGNYCMSNKTSIPTPVIPVFFVSTAVLLNAPMEWLGAEFGQLGPRLALAATLSLALALATQRYSKRLLEKLLAVEQIEEFQSAPSLFRGLETASLSGDSQWRSLTETLCGELGFSRDVLSQKTWWELTHPEDKEEEEVLRRRLERGELNFFDLRKRVVGGDGRVRHFFQRVQAERDASGELTSLELKLGALGDGNSGEVELKSRLILLEEALEAAPVGIVHFQSSGTIVSQNHRFFEICGYSSQELASLKFTNLMNPNERMRFEMALKDATYKGRNRFEIRVSLERKDRSNVPVHLHVSGCSETSQPLVAFVQDLTELDLAKKGEGAHRLSANMAMQALDSAQVGLARVESRTGKIMEANHRICEIFGYSDRELLRMNWADLNHYGDGDSEREYMDALRRGLRKEYVIEKRLERADGSPLWVRLTVLRSLFLMGELRQHTVVIEDIHDRKMSEEELIASEHKYRALVNQTLTGIYSFEGEVFTYVNDRFCAIFGYDRDELVGFKGPLDLLSEEGRRLTKDRIRNREEGRQQTDHYMVEAVRKDGEVIMLEVYGYVYQLKGQTVLSGTVLDVTERVQHDREVKDLLINTVGALGTTIDKRDPYTAGHQQRVAELSVAIARKLGLDEFVVEGIKLGALIHDIGKIQVPAEILNRPGRLGDVEFALVRNHAAAGADILKGLEGAPWPIAAIAAQHHERLDGSGYPNALKGDEILYESNIVGVADVVEAMISHRPYRPGLGLEAALGEIRSKAGKFFHPEIVEACCELFEKDGFGFSSRF